MSKMELLGASEAKNFTKQKWKQYCGTPCNNENLYQVKGREETLPDARCVDGCVYARPGSAEEYCMVPDNGEGDASVECGGDCCPLVSVGGDLGGDYVLSQYLTHKPEEVCNDGCIYTKLGDTSGDQFCFKQGETGGNNAQCKVRASYICYYPLPLCVIRLSPPHHLCCLLVAPPYQ